MYLSESYKKRLRQLSGVSESEDNYASFKGRKPYEQRRQDFFDSINTFADIIDVEVALEFFGTEGFNDEEEALEFLSEQLEFYKSMSDPVKLYRIVGVKDNEAIEVGSLGEHWTPYDWNLDGDMLGSIGYENWDEDTEPFVIEAESPLSEIDILQTIIQNLNFPNEHEINLKNKGKGAKFIKSYKL